MTAMRWVSLTQGVGQNRHPMTCPQKVAKKWTETTITTVFKSKKIGIDGQTCFAIPPLGR